MRQMQIHPQEGLLQQSRALRQSADYDECDEWWRSIDGRNWVSRRRATSEG